MVGVCTGRAIVALLSVGVAMLANVPAAGAQALAAEDSVIEFRTDLPWARVELLGNEKISGISPLRVPGPLSGNYWLRASGRGVETQRGRVRVHLDEAGARIVAYGPVSFRQRLLRSVYFPGYSQLRSLQAGKGWIMAGAGALALGSTLWAEHELREAQDALDEAARSRREGAGGDSAGALEAELAAARVHAENARDRRNLLRGATVAAWGVSLLDALLFAADFRVERAEARSLTLGMRRRRRFDAALRSFLFPGLGQGYNGQGRKAALVGLGGLGALGVYLRQQNELSQAENRLGSTRIRLASTTGGQARQALLREEARFSSEVRDRREDRNWALGIALGYWALSILDSVLSFEEPWGETTVGGPRLSAVWEAHREVSFLACSVRF